MLICLATIVSVILLATGCAAPSGPKSAELSPKPPALPVVAKPAAEATPKPEVKTTPPAPPTLAHAGVGAAVSTSSTQRENAGEGPATALVDGDLGSRWSSAYEEPQQILVTLPKARALTAVRLHWEAASAQTYSVAVSADGESWGEAETVTMDKVGPRVDSVVLGGAEVLAIKLELKTRNRPEWGFSLYEIELVAE